MNAIIFHNLIDNVNNATSNINSYFENMDSYEFDIYKILNKLPNYYIIIYIFIAFLLYNFISRYNISLNHIFILLISIVIIYFLIKFNYNNFMNYTKLKKIQLDFLHKLIFHNQYTYALKDDFNIKPNIQKTYLYLDPLIIDFYYNIKEYSQYNISSFVKSILHCNNILSIIYDAKIGLNRKYLNYQTVIYETKNALNELNSVIYNIPSSVISFNKFKNSISVLHQLLNKHIYDLSNLFKTNNKIEDINLHKMPDNFYDEYFIISPNDTDTKNYQSTYNMY
jgi:hypothetical protein